MKIAVLYIIVLLLVAFTAILTVNLHQLSRHQAESSWISVAPCDTCCDCAIEDHFFECLGEDGCCVEMDCVIYDKDEDCDVDIKDLAMAICPQPRRETLD